MPFKVIMTHTWYIIHSRSLMTAVGLNAHTNKVVTVGFIFYLMMSDPSFVTFFLSVDSKMAPFMLQVVDGVGTPTLLQGNDMFSFQGVTMLRLKDVIRAGTARKRAFFE